MREFMNIVNEGLAGEDEMLSEATPRNFGKWAASMAGAAALAAGLSGCSDTTSGSPTPVVSKADCESDGGAGCETEADSPEGAEAIDYKNEWNRRLCLAQGGDWDSSSMIPTKIADHPLRGMCSNIRQRDACADVGACPELDDKGMKQWDRDWWKAHPNLIQPKP
jgi:hypothetical protein